MSEPANPLTLDGNVNGIAKDLNRKDQTPNQKLAALSLSSQTIHADDFLNTGIQDVAPALHVSTTFRYSSNPTELVPAAQIDVNHLTHFYIASKYAAQANNSEARFASRRPHLLPLHRSEHHPPRNYPVFHPPRAHSNLCIWALW
jgi:hypothetical protein